MIRLGASVEENARATLEDIMGTPNGAANHKPSRPDIQKMRDVWNLYNSAADSSLTGDRDQEEFLKAKQEWKEKYELNDQESELVRHYQRLIQEMGMDPNKAFDQIAYSLAKHGGWYQEGSGISAFPEVVDDEQAAKKLLGGALKKYEQQGWPRLFEVISRALDDAYRRDPSSYKLWPWMVKQIKASYDAWLKYGNSRTNFDYEQRLWGQLGAAHIVDITTEGGALLSKLRAENKIPQNFDINQMNVGDFEDWLMEWKRNNVESETQGEVVYEFHNGWSIQKLTTPEQLQYEGDEMGHCVGGYSHAAGSGEVIIYSLRDDKGKPHVTMEIEGIDAGEGYWHPENERDKRQDDNHTFQIVQIQGNSNNTPKPEYQHMIKEFLDTLRAKGWKFERSENWYGNWDEGGEGDEYYNLEDNRQGYGRDRNLASALDTWYDDYYKANPQLYQGGDGMVDAYGLQRQPMKLNVHDWDELFTDCLGSLVDDYDPGRWRGRWQDLAQAVWHAWQVDEDYGHADPGRLKKEAEIFQQTIEKADETLLEWVDQMWWNAQEYQTDDIANNIRGEAETEGKLDAIEAKLDEIHGDGEWNDEDFAEYVRDEEPEIWEQAQDKVRYAIEDDYAGDAYKFLGYLNMMIGKTQLVKPHELPDPNERHGGLPSYEELENMPWNNPEYNKTQTPVEQGIEGTLSHWHEAETTLAPAPVMPDLNYVLDYEPNEEKDTGWYAYAQWITKEPQWKDHTQRMNEGFQNMDWPTSEFPKGTYSPVGITWKQAQDYLLARCGGDGPCDQIAQAEPNKEFYANTESIEWVIKKVDAEHFSHRLAIVDIGKCATCGGSIGADGYCMVCGRYNDEYWRPQRVPRFQQGMPGQEWQPYQPETEKIPGTFASFNPDEIQIHPIDEEHNLWFNEHGGENPRYEPEWIRNPETGKMEQTGPMRDTFLDNKGRQGQGYVAYHGERPVASLTYVDDPAGWYMLGSAYTHPDYREQGLFNRLVQPLRDTGKPIDAYVWNNPWLKQKVRGWQMPKTSNAWEDAHRENPPGPPQVHWVPISNDFTQEYSYPDATDYGLPFLYDWGTNTTWLGDAPFFHDDIHDADWDEEKQEHRWGIPYGASHGRYNHLQHMPSEGYTYFWNRLHPDTRAAIEQEIKKVYPHMELPYDGEEFEGEPGEERTLGDAWDEVLG